MNYQAKWSVYRAWCSRHGHSVSCPTAQKIASFLLYLCLSLSLSYSSIASYRSMLNVVFRFILPELSFHFVLRDLRSFLLERPLPSSRVPPWDLSLVLFFLQGPPFEPLASCSLRDLTRKVFFLLSLAMARRVGELQALSAQVSSSGGDLFLSYLPEFLAKTESSVCPLPCSFPVRSLLDFVGSLPEELLLCPVRAFRVYLSRTESLPSRPRSLSLLVLLLALSLRMLLAFSSGMLLRRCILLLVCLFLLLRPPPLLPLLLVLGPLCVRMGCVGSPLPGLFIVGLPCRLFLSLLLGLLLLSLPPSISQTCSSPLLVALVWVRWWRLVPWCRFLRMGYL